MKEKKSFLLAKKEAGLSIASENLLELLIPGVGLHCRFKDVAEEKSVNFTRSLSRAVFQPAFI